MTHGPAQLGVQASNSKANVASATTLFLTFLEIGGAVGNAISGFIWSRSVPKKLMLYLPDETKDQADAIFGNVTLAATGWPMGSPTRNAISQAYQETMTRILTVAVCVALPCIILSLLMENHELSKMDQGLKGTIIGSGPEDSGRRNSVSEPRLSRTTSNVYENDDREPELGDSEETTALVKRPRKNS